VYVGCGRTSCVVVIDADKLEVVGTVPVGGKPEALAADNDGRVFVNVEDKSEIVSIDPEKLTADRHLPLAPGEEPTGLAIDPERHLLFSVCGNARMVVLDSATGKVLASPVIGKRVDGAAFDPESGLAFSANGEGTLSVVATRGDKPFTVVQTLATAPGARTIAFDSKSKRLYLPTAEYEAAQPAEGGRSRRPAMKPGSFKIVVVGT
jgi:DNA-binding beta-propeller fold protein YncE